LASLKDKRRSVGILYPIVVAWITFEGELESALLHDGDYVALVEPNANVIVDG
jgi:hypothetical protein